VEPPELLRQLRRHPIWLAVGVVVAGLAAVSHFVQLVPPTLKSTHVSHATASTQLVVGRDSSLRSGGVGVPDRYLGNFAPRAEALGDMAASPLMVNYAARAADIPVSQVAVDQPLWTELQRAQQWATGQKRARQIVSERYPYHITLSDDSTAVPFSPVIDVLTQAPSVEAAAALARGVAVGVRKYLADLENEARTPAGGRYDVRQINPVVVTPPNRSQLANLAGFTFVSVFVLWCGLVLAVSSVVRDLRDARKPASPRSA
jgi:hypothetical protein